MACATLKRTLDFDPLHSPSASPKRRRCMPVLKPSTPPSQQCKKPSPFENVSSKYLNREQLANSITLEWKRLQRRKKLMEEANFSNCSASETMASTQELVQSHFQPLPSTSAGPSSSLAAGNVDAAACSAARKEQPLFTLKQVLIICERILKERDGQIKEEYDLSLIHI
ncbi:akirin-2-like [Anneissia japonica]|uniref:akirin-2-like n=1 Tax=Anneissia japonica TaxID=1529436 RepID=UPI0014257C52|nr:akirin-2-like [Anneissia japonica]